MQTTAKLSIYQANIWRNLYKVYAHKAETGSRFNLEIIDGYLDEGECLDYCGICTLDSVQAICVDVQKSDRRNTFLAIQGIEANPFVESILVIVKRNGQFCGYQWMDNRGDCLGEPTFDTTQLTSFFHAFT